MRFIATVYPEVPPRVDMRSRQPEAGRSIVHMRAVANWLVVARIAPTRRGGSFIGHVRAVANRPIVARIGDPARHNRLECLTMQASVAAGSHRGDVASTASIDRSDVREALAEIRMPVAVVGSARGPRPVVLDAGGLTPEIARQDVFAVLPPIYPEWLGERGFTAAHGVRFPYVIGEMARGIATARMTVEGVRAGDSGCFGSAGLDLGAVEAGVREIQDALGREAGGWGANLIHNIQDDGLEIATVDLFHRLGVRCVSASAFMRLTPAIVLYSAKGPAPRSRRTDHQGRTDLRQGVPRRGRRTVSSPAPEAMLRALVAEGRITAEEAKLAAEIPIAEDITAEADSGGHTDNRALTVLLPRLIALRDEIAATYDYAVLPRVGAAGGIGTPAAVAAAFAAGAAYVLTGSVNQSAVESGLSADGRNLLSLAQSTDVAMAPAADMFDLGVTVQVLKRGTMFAQRGQRLADFYAAIRRSRKPRRRSWRTSRPRFSDAAWKRSGPIPRRSSRGATHGRWNVRVRTLDIAWRSCFAGICSAAHSGHAKAMSRGAPITRSCTARPWAPSTNGCGGVSSNRWMRARFARSRSICSREPPP